MVRVEERRGGGGSQVKIIRNHYKLGLWSSRNLEDYRRMDLYNFKSENVVLYPGRLGEVK